MQKNRRGKIADPLENLASSKYILNISFTHTQRSEIPNLVALLVVLDDERAWKNFEGMVCQN